MRERETSTDNPTRVGIALHEREIMARQIWQVSRVVTAESSA